MTKDEELQAELTHMENRTQWRKDDVKRVEKLRDDVHAAEKGRPLTDKERQNNRVKHHH